MWYLVDCTRLCYRDNTRWYKFVSYTTFSFGYSIFKSFVFLLRLSIKFKSLIYILIKKCDLLFTLSRCKIGSSYTSFDVEWRLWYNVACRLLMLLIFLNISLLLSSGSNHSDVAFKSIASIPIIYSITIVHLQVKRKQKPEVWCFFWQWIIV